MGMGAPLLFDVDFLTLVWYNFIIESNRIIQNLEDWFLMRISIYDNLPNDAREIRTAVFIHEQGFQKELDEIDNNAVHLVCYSEDDTPIATCRVFWDSDMDAYVLGRLAVIKKYRGKQIGSAMLKEAEQFVREKGGKALLLHSQCRAVDFYKKSGFTEFGNVENDEGCPHIWMKKFI